MSERFSGRTVLITGAIGELGKAMARAFADEGQRYRDRPQGDVRRDSIFGQSVDGSLVLMLITAIRSILISSLVLQYR